MILWIISQVKKAIGKPENAVYTKLKAVLKHQHTINKYTHIYYLGGFEYSEENYRNYKKTGAASLMHFLSAVQYNVLADNVEIYFIKNNHSGDTYLLTLFDPVQLYFPEEILEISTNPDINYFDLNYQQIFPYANENGMG